MVEGVFGLRKKLDVQIICDIIKYMIEEKLMSKRKKRGPKYNRNNHIKTDKSITISKYDKIFVSYDKCQFIISDEAGNPYDTGLQSMTRFYQGERKKRVVAKATHLQYMTNEVGSWSDNFDFVFAVDTNTHLQKCEGFFCSAAMVYYGDIKRISDYERNMICKPFMIIDWYHSSKIKIETVTWMELIKKLQEIIPKDKKVGIVIDSELGKLEGYNNHTTPIFEQWFLPENYTFMYATADSNDEWCNKMIKQCDKGATQRLKEIIKAPRIKNNSSEISVPIGFLTIFSENLPLIE